jgi:hypothetical protein
VVHGGQPVVPRPRSLRLVQPYRLETKPRTILLTAADTTELLVLTAGFEPVWLKYLTLCSCCVEGCAVESESVNEQVGKVQTHGTAGLREGALRVG